MAGVMVMALRGFVFVLGLQLFALAVAAAHVATKCSVLAVVVQGAAVAVTEAAVMTLGVGAVSGPVQQN
jgi:hypothetical protein